MIACCSLSLQRWQSESYEVGVLRSVSIKPYGPRFANLRFFTRFITRFKIISYHRAPPQVQSAYSGVIYDLEVQPGDENAFEGFNYDDVDQATDDDDNQQPKYTQSSVGFVNYVSKNNLPKPHQNEFKLQ